MFAVIKTGGKQYVVAPSDVITIEKLPQEVGEKVSFDEVLLFSDGAKQEVGMPTLTTVAVEGEVVKQGRGKKKIIFKYHSKARVRKTKGHRQDFTQVKITKIG